MANTELPQSAKNTYESFIAVTKWVVPLIGAAVLAVIVLIS